MISTNTLIAVAAYYRMSSDKQEKSIPEQRAEVEKFAAKHGYRIVAEYLDEGISGDDTKRRNGFQKLVKDAPAGKFSAVICWDQSRFGRFNSREAGYWTHQLVESGVTKLISVADGVIDFDSDIDTTMFNLRQDFTNKKYLTDLSRNSVRGKVTVAKQGFQVGGTPPYGYDHMYVDAASEPRQRVRRGERFAKPREWKLTLVVSDDETKVETVRWMYERFATSDISMRQLAIELNERGTLSPAGKPWHINTVRKILDHPVYCGDVAYGRTRGAKYHTITGGELAKRDTSQRDGNTERGDWIIKKNAVPAIIDRPLWKKVQARLAERATVWHPRKHSFPLTGVVYCGHCGEKMRGEYKNINGNEYRYFKCKTYQLYGGNACQSNCTDERGIQKVVMNAVFDRVLGPDQIKRIERSAERLAGQREGDGVQRSKALEKRIRGLDRNIDRGTKNLLLADPDHVPDMQKQLTAWREERDSAREALEALDAPQTANAAAQAQAAIAELQRVREGLETGDAALMRELMRRLVDRVDLYFSHEKRGKKTISQLTRGVVTLKVSDFRLLHTTSRRS